jgi:hypothetical protein
MLLFDMLIHTNKLTCSGLKESIEGEDNTIHGSMADVGNDGNDDDDEGAASGTRVLVTVKLAKTLRK